ncbi:Replication factor C small subunit [Candidatus Gugararchaeum adminiculabundum]|nr:Replication factor C small subunit [Candidatus Gugararchaeum adminiculabundum]
MGDSIDVMPWTEKYRPKNLSDVIGQKEITEHLRAFVKAKNMPNMLFAGPPGIGKTTATIALARELFGDQYKDAILEMNASDERGIDIVRGKIKDFARTVSLASVPFKLIFLDEADALTSDAQHALRRTMEVYVQNTRFILSCNYSSKIIEPLQSRCAVFRFKPLADADFNEMINRVAHAEGLKVEKDAIEALTYIAEGDMRRAINALQGASLFTKHINKEAVYRFASRANPLEIKEMVELALKGDFKESRKKLDTIMLQYGLSGEDVIIQVYREVINNDKIPDKQKVALVDRIGEYDFRIVEGANDRLQLEALLAQLGVIGK